MILVELRHMDLSIFAAKKGKITKNTLLTKIDFCNSGLLLVLLH
jgi:hypothetical protein